MKFMWLICQLWSIGVALHNKMEWRQRKGEGEGDGKGGSGESSLVDNEL